MTPQKGHAVWSQLSKLAVENGLTQSKASHFLDGSQWIPRTWYPHFLQLKSENLVMFFVSKTSSQFGHIRCIGLSSKSTFHST